MTEPRFARPPAAGAGGPKIVCLSHLGGASPPRLRLLARRLRRHSPADAEILLGLWSGMPHYLDDRPERPEVIDEVATSLSDAVEYILERVTPDRATAQESAKTARAG
jgi:hypothetical protein